ncbi:hypothetical protein OJAV_G00229210 [Oryzias javanicus]|uniref:Uncharacterized protein n=1 Tax=Oryzias javanicus TaxID=123683 RepID=A0A3S2P9H2_ORYJA|nr:hypothetical protein OJAV_G00229210 [Oryzias javanicus]
MTGKMSKMTIVQLGMVVIAISLTTQVVSQNSTSMTGMNSTSNATAMPTETYSSSGNSTSPTGGAGVSLHAGTLSVLIPVVTAASLLQRCCC